MPPRAPSRMGHSKALVPKQATRGVDHQILQQRWNKLNSNLKKLRFDRSPFVPENFGQYVDHLHDMESIRAKQKTVPVEVTSQKSADMIALMAHLRPGPSSIEQVIDPASFRERVIGLANVTIWAPTFQPTGDRPMALWPSLQELREEGDERHTSQFGRFLPIPRTPGNSSSGWKHRGFLEQYEMDRVRPVPKLCSGVQLPDDIEVWEPTVNEDGVYVDDQNESGRQSLGDTTGRLFHRRSVDWNATSSDASFGPDTYLQRSKWFPEASAASAIPQKQSKFWSSEDWKQDASHGNNLLAQMGRTNQERDNPIAVALAEEVLGSSRPQRSDFVGNAKSGNDTDAVQLNMPFKGQMQSQGGAALDSGGQYGERAMHSGNPWRSVSYGRNSFGANDTIHEESPEELMETIFGKVGKHSSKHSPSHGSIESDKKHRLSNASLVSRSDSVSPMSLQRPVRGTAQYYQGPRSNTADRLEEDFGRLGFNR